MIVERMPSRAERFAEALELLCGEKPPADLAAKWLAWDESHVDVGADTLQDWAASHAKLPWLMGITICEAAEAMADEPDENLISRIEDYHVALTGKMLPYLWWKG
jgi:hypothetical protein